MRLVVFLVVETLGNFKAPYLRSPLSRATSKSVSRLEINPGICFPIFIVVIPSLAAACTSS